MTFKSVNFRTRGGSTQGWGNIFRLSWFASYCRDRGVNNITFFVEGPKEVSSYLASLNFVVVNLDEGISLEDEKKIFSKYPESDVIVMEMLESNYDRQKILKKFTKKLVVFDDLMDHQYCSNLLVCGQDLPNYGNKSISDDITIFKTGYRYFMANPDFKKYSLKKKKYPHQIKKLLIVFGGGKYDIAYIKTAHAISKIDNLNIEIILGYSSNNKLVEQLREILPYSKIIGGVSDIAQRLWESDFAIVSAGYCKIEAALTKTPAISIATQWHQIPLGEEFYRYCGMPFLGYMGFVSTENILDSLLIQAQLENRLQMIERYDSIDANGMSRTYKLVESLFNTNP